MTKVSPKRVSQQHKRQQAIALRMKGHSLSEIAEMLGYGSAGAVHNAISRELSQASKQGAEEMREIETRRIEALIKNIWDSCMDDPKKPHTLDVIKVYIRLSSRLGQIYGFDFRREPEGGGKGAAASASITLIQMRPGAPARTVQGLSDKELQQVVAVEEGNVEEGEYRDLADMDDEELKALLPAENGDAEEKDAAASDSNPSE